MINIATVFSGIGAAEHALDLMGVDANIVFACDNGERYLKPSNKALLKQFEEETDPAKKEELARQLYEDSKKAIEETLPPVEDPVARELAVCKLYDTTRRVNYVEQSYRANYHIGEGRWFQDVRFLDGTRFANKVDVFVGGSPCQSFSTYGKKGGLGDARGTLFYEYARLVQQIQPKCQGSSYSQEWRYVEADAGDIQKSPVRHIRRSLGCCRLRPPTDAEKDVCHWNKKRC